MSRAPHTTTGDLSVPWRRPGRFVYAMERIGHALRPPVTVEAPPESVELQRDVPVVMRDGITLHANVYRPVRPGRYPVIVSVHPYGKDRLAKKTRRGWRVPFQYRVMHTSEPIAISALTSWEAPDPVWWVDRGYVVVNADERGTGASQGVGSLLTRAEARDNHDLVEWAGHQEWSSGKVGMLGVSYLALSQYRTATTHPPSLKAICPWEGFTDAYRDFMTPGGVAETGFSRIWQATTKRRARLHGDFARERRRHPRRDDWWEALTPDLSRIDVPMLVCASFSDANLHSIGSFRAFTQVTSPDRFAYLHRGPKWSTFYGAEAKAAQLAFFDKYLRDEDLAAPPRVRLEVRDTLTEVTEVRSENEWPLARTEWTPLYLAAGGRLTSEPGGDGDQPGAATFDLRRNAACFTFTFAEATEVTGPMHLTVWVAAATPDGDACLFFGVDKVRDGKAVPFEGSYGYRRDRVASGRLRLALRRTDAGASLPHQPEHGYDRFEPPGRNHLVRLDVALSPSATVFRPGDSLKLLVAGRPLEPRNPLFGQFPAAYARSARGTATLSWGDEQPAALVIPIIPRVGE